MHSQSLILRFVESCNIPEISTVKISCDQKGDKRELILDCQQGKIASYLYFDCYDLISQTMQKLEISLVKISINGIFYWKIPPKHYSFNNFVTMSQLLFPKATDLPTIDLNESYKSQSPVYIVSMLTGLTLFNNLAAKESQQNLPDDLMKCVSLSLNYTDELARRHQLLKNDKNHRINEYECKSMRWKKNVDDDGIIFWRRKEIELVMNLELCEFLGEPARKSKILQATELSRYVD